jgi:hypothetical protein
LLEAFLAIDLAIIDEMLTAVWGDRLESHVQRSNPLIRVRVNAMNSRIRSTSGVVSFLIDPVHAPILVHDFEDLVWEDGSGEKIETEKNTLIGHLFDAISYREWRDHSPYDSAGLVMPA